MKKIMSFISGDNEQVERSPTVIGGETKTKIEKIDFNIRRFSLALQQCRKGPERSAELKRNLDYWTALKKAEQSLEGLK